jgi:uncharacterized Fe-S cluster protein YjdI
MIVAERTYTNGEISVLWQSELCTHCEACFKGLPSVFDPKARPWVKIDAATSEEIVAQVNQCPSGALSIL